MAEFEKSKMFIENDDMNELPESKEFTNESKKFASEVREDLRKDSFETLQDGIKELYDKCKSVSEFIKHIVELFTREVEHEKEAAKLIECMGIGENPKCEYVLRTKELERKLQNEVRKHQNEIREHSVTKTKLQAALEREAKCRRGGRPLKLYESDKPEITRMRADGMSYGQIAKQYGCSSSTARKFFKDRCKIDS